MIGLLQRVSQASVSVDGRIIGQIQHGLLVLLGVEKNDSREGAKRMAARLGGYRVFADANDKMNLNVADVGGGILLVPQFTLAAETHKGLRPSFQSAAEPELGRALFGAVHKELEALGLPVATGRFGANMQVSLTNDGPVTFWLQVKPECAVG